MIALCQARTNTPLGHGLLREKHCANGSMGLVPFQLQRLENGMHL